ncbi:MAG TPA: peptidylprolyl isomerase [Gammaproteobacteria bacterium]|nr:peptidylprolyl isomerase [Gammaproteobacteria bacterium]
MLKTPLRPLAVLAAALILVQGCASTPPPPPPSDVSTAKTAPNPEQEKLAHAGTELDRIVAVVNDQVILESELEKRVADVIQQISARNTALPPKDVLRKQVLDQMITAKLELQQAEGKGIAVSDDEVNQTISRIAERNGVTLSQLPDKLKEEGVNYADFRQELRDQITIQELQQRLIRDQMRITPREVEAQLKQDQESGDTNTQYHLSQILIATPVNPTADQIAAAHKNAQAIYEKLKQGADFAATAIASSDGQQALKGGDLGWRKQSELPTIFTNIIISMKPGDISEPVQSPSGFHIVKVDDVKHQDDKVVVTQTHARHILIKTSALMTDAQAKAKLEELRKQILAGADFAKLAREYSDDTGSASDGGDLGWVDPGATVPIFEQEMDKLQVGQISEPFKSQYGWHIVQVLGHRKSDQTEEARKNKAYDAIYARKSDEILQDWLSQLRGSAYIEYHLDDSSSRN